MVFNERLAARRPLRPARVEAVPEQQPVRAPEPFNPDIYDEARRQLRAEGNEFPSIQQALNRYNALMAERAGGF